MRINKGWNTLLANRMLTQCNGGQLTKMQLFWQLLATDQIRAKQNPRS